MKRVPSTVTIAVLAWGFALLAAPATAAAAKGEIVATYDSGLDAASGLGWDGSYLWITSDKTSIDLRPSRFWKFDPGSYAEVCHRDQVFGENNKGLAFTGESGQFWTTRFNYPELFLDDLVLLDLHGSLVRAFPAYGNVGGVAYDPETTHLYQVDNHSTLPGGSAMDGQLYVVDSVTGGVVAGPTTIPVKKARGVAWDGRHLWVISNETDSAYRIDVATGAVVDQFYIQPVGGTVEGIAWDGACLWITENADDKIYRVDHGQADLPPCTATIPNAGVTASCAATGDDDGDPGPGPDAEPPPDSGGAPADPDDPAGGCSAGAPGSGAGLALVLVAVLARRRRRS